MTCSTISQRPLLPRRVELCVRRVRSFRRVLRQPRPEFLFRLNRWANADRRFRPYGKPDPEGDGRACSSLPPYPN